MEKNFCVRLDAASQTFSAAHFITFDSAICEALHGHDFHVSVELEQSMSDSGCVIDFVQFSDALQKLLQKLDHKTLIQGENPKIRLTMEEVEPDEQPDVMNWMSKVGGWLSSVNQYSSNAEKELTPDDYFQKMAQMAADGIGGEDEPACLLESESGADFSATESEFASGIPNGISNGITNGVSCGISNGMTAQRIELDVRYGSYHWVFPMEDCVILPLSNMTAELLAEYLAEQLSQCDLLTTSGWLRLTVEVEEAPGMKGICTLKN